MAWTAPSTWVAGAVLTAAQLNTQLTDNLLTFTTITTPTFAAGDYTASAGTWTVDSGDVLTMAYQITGNKVMRLWLSLSSTDVSATPATLRRVIPASYLATKRADFPILYNDAGGTLTVGSGQVTAGGTLLTFSPITGTWSTTASDNTNIFVVTAFEVTPP